MQEDIAEKIEELKATGTAQLSELYRQLSGNKAAPGNRGFLIRQLAYRIQEKAIGELSSAVRDRIQELLQTYDPINKTTVRNNAGKTASGRDARLPMPGSFITKTYKGKRLEVKVLEGSFEYQGTNFKNLSAVAKEITGAHWNGFAFFGVKINGNPPKRIGRAHPRRVADKYAVTSYG